MRAPARARAGRHRPGRLSARLHREPHAAARARHEVSAMSLEIYAAYVLACLLITLIPGPTVTLIVANSLAHGTRAGLLNVAGTQAGLFLMMLTLIVGLSSVIEAMGWLFDWLRIAGALYLVWLGWKLIKNPDLNIDSGKVAAPRGGF